MMERFEKYSSKHRVKIYWIIWEVSIILVFSIKLLWNNVTDKQLTSLFTTYVLLVSVPLYLTTFFKQINLVNYLQTHHQQKWEERFGRKLIWFTFSRSKMKQIYFSKEDFGDPILTLIRKDYRSFYIFTNLVIISTLLIAVIMMSAFPVK